ncbi:MAG: DNA polymerase III subunit gamma/tau [Verrucomicrobiia bacterium]
MAPQYQVLARKWRPQQFDDVVGQEHVTTTLKNAIEQNRLAHAYLFVGPRGIGKTSTARIFAKALNCVKGPTTTPCDKCDNCKEIMAGNSLDVLEIDGASNRGIDEVRELRDTCRYAPARGRFKIYIIDEVHMLTKEAFNALLKTLEEPPPHVKFFFATTEPHKLPQTVLSRCQRFDFRRIPITDLVKTIKGIAEKENLEIEKEASYVLARRADGSLRDLLSLLDQVIAYSSEGESEKEGRRTISSSSAMARS